MALTGGIASGKSLAATHLAKLGAKVIDADELAREVVAPDTPGFIAIQARWGEAVIAPDGTLNREALARIVFNDSAELAALNAITHPQINDRMWEIVEQTRAEDRKRVIIYDVPLLYGSCRQYAAQANIAIVIPRELQMERLMHYRGADIADARNRIDSQATDAQLASISDVVVRNEGDQAELMVRIEQLWEDWIIPFNDVLCNPAAVAPKRPAGLGVGFFADPRVHKERLAYHGIAVREIPGGFEAIGTPDPAGLLNAGWIAHGQEAFAANPCAPLILRWG
ncbi:MAG: dephospho-CoA kinase [Trueperella sp.]|nr:dephospho-CoA kinase [Trueperella sp.]